MSKVIKERGEKLKTRKKKIIEEKGIKKRNLRILCGKRMDIEGKRKKEQEIKKE